LDDSLPEVRYARSGDVDVAFMVLGSGAVDLVLVMGWLTNLEVHWEEPSYRRFVQRLARFTRLILFDKRGMGLSDRTTVGTLEERMDDVRAVMDAAGSERAVLFGISEGAPLSMLFAGQSSGAHRSSDLRRRRGQRGQERRLAVGSVDPRRVRGDDGPSPRVQHVGDPLAGVLRT
jgi:pimeloyl-ACP methyl ester carboxylesterase